MLQLHHDPVHRRARNYVCVIAVTSHAVRYIGDDFDAAAEHLEPGTTYGHGETPEAAELAAVRSALSIKNEARLQAEAARADFRRRVVGG